MFLELALQVPAAGPAMRLHRLVVDSYCLQHPASYCRSPKSMAAHLTGLCCGLPYSGHPNVYRALQQWLSHAKDLYRPVPPRQTVAVTVHDVYRAFHSQVFVETLENWAKTVWELWSPHHALARAWIKAALGG